jgi:serine/threonine protein kinase
VAPRNIIFNSYMRPVLCDFGLSRLTRVGGDGGHTKTAGLEISIRWMAPEVLTSSPKYFYASDVWSLGVVLWQILTRQHLPYPKVKDLLAVVHGVSSLQLDLRSSLPPQPEWATLRALVHKHDDIVIGFL